ncbi:cytochrome d ubiquinol oxidase subunit II [Actinokineospora auranticolor]|uniref:Cytochrome d ubiquinol oxidase subunit II n=1 Tax=Actinokineospora auranticolor TaxID=155976 RepID=A0A2S6GF52_9PSEU|nr:cytochrome d ubiquinol oxidase subunit II [Actinokineospora auranticolor]PPK63852.1 cytochrome d ubiquinol oxidase subunit II [Actinokineospora auranticolor]
MATLWLVAFGLLFTGYLALAGIDYGVAVLLPRVARTESERRLALNAISPFLLGNEVWLVVSIGILIGTLPGLESRLLVGALPLALIAVVGAIVFIVSVHLRGRGAGGSWDTLVFLGGALAAFGWGAVLTSLAGGLPLDASGHVTGTSVSLFAILGGLTMVSLLAVRGGAFLAARTTGAVAERARRAVVTLVLPTGALLILTVATGWASGELDGVRNPALGSALSLVALLGLAGLWRRWAGASVVAVAFVPLSVFAAKYPTPITADPPGTSPSLADLAADPAGLALVTWTAIPLLLLVIAVQGWVWWVFRGRVTRQSPIFY